MTDLPPYVQSFIGPTALGIVALIVWGIKQGWFVRKTIRADLRAERKEDATEEYELAVEDDKVANLKIERELKINDVWKAQFKEQESRNKDQLTELESRRQQDYAEYTHRLLGYQKEMSDVRAEVKLLKEENVKCSKTATEQAVRIGGLEDRSAIVLKAAEAQGIKLGLDWMHPKPPMTTTTIVQTETPSPSPLEGPK